MNRHNTTSRSGSILIMVVALLVMIALIATAMLSTTRNDRFASKQNEANVQIDLLVKGATDIALGTIANDQLGDVGGGSVFRPGDASKTSSTYDPYDAFSTFYPVNGVYGNQNDKWLMPRTPTLQSFNVAGRVTPPYAPGTFPPTANNTTNLPIWQSITAPLAADAFESPALYSPYPLTASAGGNLPPTYRPSNSQRAFIAAGVTQYARSEIIPTTYRTSSGVAYPALAVFNLDLATPRFVTYLAADCDGDGIADSMLQKLPMGPINGVTYYVAYRIIDQNSALNANTATSVRSDFGNIPTPGVQATNLALFPTNIGLFEILRRNRSVLLNTPPATLTTLTPGGVNDDFYNLMNVRQAAASGAVNFVPDGLIGGAAPKDQPRDDGGAAVNTYRYLTVADALWHGLGRRLGNPGVASATAAGAVYKYAPFGVGDTMSLSYPFAWRPASASTTTLETALGFTIANKAPDTNVISKSAFTPNDLATWYENFDWFDNYSTTNTAQFKQLRPILTTFNPVSNASSQANVLPALTFDYINPTTGLSTGTSALTSFGDGAPRASLNTADFGTLMRAYFAAMAEDWTGAQGAGSPFTYQITNFTWPTASDQFDPFHGMKWTEPLIPEAPVYPAVILPAATTVNETAPYQHPSRSFRSSLRPPTNAVARPVTWPNTTPKLEADQMVILRAAIAAANVKELRDSDDNIYPVEVSQLQVNTAPTTRVPVRARIYGLERQPFLSEVYVQTDDSVNTSTDAAVVGKQNPAGYVALEFYNPYPFPIDLRNCRLTALDRSNGGSYPNMAIGVTLPLTTAISNMATAVPAGWSAATIPPKGFLILENYAASGAPAINGARYRPRAMQVAGTTIAAPANPNLPGGTYWSYVPGLEDLVYNKELVLVRPLLAVEPTVAGTGYSPLTYTWDAGLIVPTSTAPATIDMAPLDSFDFSGLFLPNPTGYPVTAPPTPPPATPHAYTGKATAWHYARRTPVRNPANTADDPASKYWHFVYPGRYNTAATVLDPTVFNMPRPRHQGVQEDGYDGKTYFTPNFRDPWEPVAGAPGLPVGEAVVGIYPPTIGNYPRITLNINPPIAAQVNDTFASYPQTFPIQLSNADMPGPYLRQPDSILATAYCYPFGGFARNGDALDAPYIGSYRITLDVPTPVTLIELNSVSMDAAMAEDTDVNDDPLDADNGAQSREQIGRFCPLNQSLATGVVTDSDQGASYTAYQADLKAYGDFDDANQFRWRYRWASDLLDYVSMHSPNDDYAPNVLPSSFTNPISLAQIGVPTAVSNSGSPASQSQTTAGGQPGAGVNVTSEVGEPIHGLVNLNTSSWQVLAMVPWFARNTNADLLTYNPDTQLWSVAANAIDDNAEMARAIVAWRDGDVAAGIGGHGPFKSLFDLYRVPAFRNAQVFLLSPAFAANGPDDAEGDLSPFNYPGGPATVDDVRFDYEEQCLLFKRISNLLTTRSDAFTLYLIVQGWRNTGTNNPELVVQRRAAMIVDRSRSDGKNLTPSVYNIPTQP